MFGLRGEPSAEALAGSGPTTTYPAPPSASATPEAIASIAGGTAAPGSTSAKPAGPRTAQVAGFDVSPGYATPASNTTPASTNMAAAQANGIYDGATTSPLSAESGSLGVPKTTPLGHKPSGYSFGAKSTTPKPESSPAYVADSPSAYAKTVSATPSPSTDTPASANSFTPPPTSSYTTPPTKGSSGYTLPTDSPAVAAITPPSPPEPTQSPEVEPANSFAPPAATAPDFSTASAAGAITSSTSLTDEAAEDPDSGYSPGSTGSAVGYPSGDATPATSGSFYR